MKIILIFFFTLVTGLFFGGYAAGQLAVSPGNVEQQGSTATFTEVAKIFDLRCVSCHSGARAPEGLRLDSYKNVMAGGKDGPVIVPGKPSESKLLKHISGDLKPRMPKNGPPWLTDVQTDLIQRWISAGSQDGL